MQYKLLTKIKLISNYMVIQAICPPMLEFGLHTFLKDRNYLCTLKDSKNEHPILSFDLRYTLQHIK